MNYNVLDSGKILLDRSSITYPAKLDLLGFSKGIFKLEVLEPCFVFGAIPKSVQNKVNERRFYVNGNIIGTIVGGDTYTNHIHLMPDIYTIKANSVKSTLLGITTEDIFKYEKNNKKLGLAVVAIGIEKNIKERFINNINSMQLENFAIKVVTERLSSVWNKSIYLNSAISSLIYEDKCDVIATTDIDMMFTKDLIEFSRYKCCDGTGVWNLNTLVDLNNWSKEKELEVYNSHPLVPECQGGWFCLSKNDWLQHGGYDESLTGWGYEDIKAQTRYKEVIKGNIFKSVFPLSHLSHPWRYSTGRLETNKDKVHTSQNNYIRR